MVVSLCLVLCLSFASVQCYGEAKYPMLMWSEHAFEHAQESINALTMVSALDLVKSKVEASKAVNVVAIVREGLTSRELVNHAKSLKFVKTSVEKSAELYSNL